MERTGGQTYLVHVVDNVLSELGVNLLRALLVRPLLRGIRLPSMRVTAQQSVSQSHFPDSRDEEGRTLCSAESAR